MSSTRKRVTTTGGDQLAQDPFAALAGLNLPTAPTPPNRQPAAPSKPKNLGRVEVRRLKAGRAGKTVTEISGFADTDPERLGTLAQRLKSTLGTGGTAREGVVEIQGDRVDEVLAALTQEGYRPVKAGG